MQSMASALSPSPSFLDLGKPPDRNPNPKAFPIFHSSPSTRQLELHASTFHCATFPSLVFSQSFASRTFATFLFSDCRFDRFRARTAPIPGRSDDSAESKKWIRRVQLASMFAIWYLLNIYFNIYNKQVLKVYPFPATFTAFQFGCGTVIAALMWTFNLHGRPKVTGAQLAAILPLAVAHAIGNLLTNVSIGKVAVSFTHTIKAMEPFFTVVLAALFLGERSNLWVVSSLVPVVGGVALASFTEASFNWTGFCSAMASNLTNQSRNVLSKKFMVNMEALDNINLFSIMTVISFVLMVPMAIMIEGIKFSPAYLQAAASQGLNVRELCIRSLIVGLCFHSYQQVSYMILQMVSPVTHSVGNCVKRVVVIVSSVIFFQTPVSPINSLGTGLALAGVFLYAKAKQIKPKPKAA